MRVDQDAPRCHVEGRKPEKETEQLDILKIQHVVKTDSVFFLSQATLVAQVHLLRPSAA